MAAPALLALEERLFATGNGPLEIESVEPIAIRTPRGEKPPDWYLEMGPVGQATGGSGLWNRLDHASPSRFRGATQATLVKIVTRDGLVGWGECHAPASPRVHAMVISDLLAPILIGQDARQVEPLWERLYSSQRLRGYATGFYTESIAGVDLALWDLLGKYLGQPLYRILGGKYRDSIPTYSGIRGRSPRELGESARRQMEAGFPAVKMGLSKGPGTSNIERVMAVSEAIDGTGQLPGGFSRAYKIHEARAVGARLDELSNIGWWEDALCGGHYGLHRAQGGSQDAPLRGRDALEPLPVPGAVRARAVDMVNPDLCRAGGVSECRRIAVLADLHGVLFSPAHQHRHGPCTGRRRSTLAAHLPNTVIMEGGTLLERRLVTGCSGNRWSPAPVRAIVPERPGIGAEFDESVLERYRVA